MGVLGDSGIAHLVHVCASVMRKRLCQQAGTEALGSELLLFHQEKYSASHLLWLLTGELEVRAVKSDWGHHLLRFGLLWRHPEERSCHCGYAGWEESPAWCLMSCLRNACHPACVCPSRPLGLPTDGVPPSWPLSAVPTLQWKCPFWASQRKILAVPP